MCVQFKDIYFFVIYLYTYMTYSQDYNLASHITYVVCFKFMLKGRNLELKVNSEGQIFKKKIFMEILFTSTVLAKDLLSDHYWPILYLKKRHCLIDLIRSYFMTICMYVFIFSTRIFSFTISLAIGIFSFVNEILLSCLFIFKAIYSK